MTTALNTANSDLTIGEAAPDFCLPATGEKTIRLSSLRGHNVVLYFYPKDATPGCTLEAQNFRDYLPKFKKANTVILGISRDSMRAHENFKGREALDFDLLADIDETACRLYDVIKEKNLYGKKVMGVERSTFLIDTQGQLLKEWRKVKVEGHVDAVLAAVKQIA